MTFNHIFLHILLKLIFIIIYLSHVVFSYICIHQLINNHITAYYHIISYINHGIAMLENKILMNCENSKNLKSNEFYFFISSAILSAFDLYFSMSI